MAFIGPTGGATVELRAGLEQAGLAVRTFQRASQLVEAAIMLQPYVIVLDVDRTADEGGLDTARRLKEDPLTRPVPIILLARGGDEVGAECLDAGADDFLLEPVRSRDVCLRARVAARTYEAFQRRHEQHAELADMYFRLAETEEKARLSEARARAIFETAQDAVFTLDGEGRIDLMNGAAEAMFRLSREDAATIRFLDLVAGGAARGALGDALARVAAGDAPSERREVVARSRTGEEFPVDCSITCAEREGPTVCVFVRDLRVARRLEALLRQTQHLEAVGRIAAGIAHEINTPIQCIADTLHFLDQTFAEIRPLIGAYRDAVAAAEAGVDIADSAARARDAESTADVEYVLEAAPAAVGRAVEMSQRIAEIVRATKDFTRPDQRGASVFDIGALVRSVLDLSRAAYADAVDVESEIEEVDVVAHVGEIGDAIRHVLFNAADAVRATGRRGRIWLRVGRTDDAAQVTVSDDGCGVAPEIAQRIFDPFFTTKDVGRGVGLGLFSASAAARRHGGSLSFEARSGGGSTFMLRMPLALLSPG
jgi:two-component system NtrC family sensor kinase